MAMLVGLGVGLAGIGMLSGKRISKKEELPKSIGGHADASNAGFKQTDKSMSSTEVRSAVQGRNPT